MNKIEYCLFLKTGREELLTEHAMDWNKRKIKKLSSLLAKRYAKVITFSIYILPNSNGPPQYKGVVFFLIIFVYE